MKLFEEIFLRRTFFPENEHYNCKRDYYRQFISFSIQLFVEQIIYQKENEMKASFNQNVRHYLHSQLLFYIFVFKTHHFDLSTYFEAMKKI